MILGLPFSTFTAIHVALSLIGIGAGLVVLKRMLSGDLSGPWTTIFLATTLLTSVTGFLFPISGFTPALGFGVVSVIALAAAYYGLHGARLGGRWRAIFVTAALFALYLNCFVGVVQAFRKVPALNALAPTESELPFALTQVALLALFLYGGYLALRRKSGVAGPRRTMA